MVLGTASSVGKSTLVTALCRIAVRRGLRVAPFKAQNMSNNAAVTASGGEIGRSTAVQAAAARIAPTVTMNPILIKPEGERRSQVIVEGQLWRSLDAADYWQRKQMLWDIVIRNLDALRTEYDLVIAEGAGSPVELNLKPHDIVNMRVASYAQARTLLVGHIDVGGITGRCSVALCALEHRPPSQPNQHHRDNQLPPYLVTLEQLIADVVAPAAAEIDQAGAFPRGARCAWRGRAARAD
jgi:adenosylcobyric acid synthase